MARTPHSRSETKQTRARHIYIHTGHTNSRILHVGESLWPRIQYLLSLTTSTHPIQDIPQKTSQSFNHPPIGAELAPQPKLFSAVRPSKPSPKFPNRTKNKHQKNHHLELHILSNERQGGIYLRPEYPFHRISVDRHVNRQASKWV